MGAARKTSYSDQHSLAIQIGDILSQHSSRAGLMWMRYFQVTANVDPHMERRQINEYLRIQLGQMPMDTTSQRECLTDEASFPDYIRHFATYVAPFIARHGLPAWNQG